MNEQECAGVSPISQGSSEELHARRKEETSGKIVPSPVEPLEGEEWREWPRSKRYLISSMARVYSFWLKGLRKPQLGEPNGYYSIRMDCKNYELHKVVALTFFGEHRGMVVDHIDHDHQNNILSNLRLLTHPQNCKRLFNKMRSDNTSGVKGVHYQKHDGKWSSRIKILGKTYYKSFSSFEEAASHATSIRSDL